MDLVRWDPFRELATIHDRLSRMMSEAPLGRSEEQGYGAFSPPVDIFQRGDEMVIRAEVPGISRDDIDVRVEDGRLILQGERRRDTEINEKNAYRLERVYGTFTRMFALPTTVDPSKIQAIYKNGVLEVVLPKTEEAKPRKVTIKTE